MKKVTTLLLIGSLVAVLSLSGCSSSSAEESDKDTSATVQAETVQGLQYGQIKSIDENQMTIALGTVNSAPSPDGKQTAASDGQTPSAVQAPPEGQTPPAKPSGEDTKGGQPPEKPDGQNPPDGNPAPNGDQSGASNKSNITLTDQTLTVTIADSTTVGYMNSSTSSAAISDLSVGTTIAVKLGEDGKTAEQILIIK
ncbi:hypothetical protein [Aminipila luticellarii]|uniref:DUF5666 domain-containing protein n=1 Tax=Aminipila luticellarii TaxID=2507160 RepID=A0A410PXL8_9FIRM|nr:hypothetical protein [Aminipila luticellarii]QAT43616.1 hypothetical protein EQM06_10500 [Aminipila luticellarii]